MKPPQILPIWPPRISPSFITQEHNGEGEEWACSCHQLIYFHQSVCKPKYSSINGCRQGHSTDIAWPLCCLWHHRPHYPPEKTWWLVWGYWEALNWFKSYLTGRCQSIRLGDCLSSKADLKFGVPEGSVLGPLLFTLYTTPLSGMIFEHAIPNHFYADDSQLYVSFASGDSAAALYVLQSCLASVQSWMSTNKLKLNPDKTEFLLIGNEHQRRKYLPMFQIELFGVKTNSAKSASNLRVIFNKHFTFCSHISAVCSSCFYYMPDLRVFAVTLIWIVQNYLQLLSCPVVSIVAIHFCIVLLTLSS